MAYAGKTYAHVKDENFSEFLGGLGVSAEKVEQLLKSKPTQKLEKNGDSYVLTTTDSRGTKELKFQSGVEFDEEVSEGIYAKTTITVSGDVVTQEQKFGDGRTMIIKREYSGNNLNVTVTASTVDGSARRFYSAA